MRLRRFLLATIKLKMVHWGFKMKLIDLTGQRYGRLIVVSRAPNRGQHVCWHCVCDCGNEKDIRANDLRSGRTTSCGCYQREKTIERCRINLIGQKFGKLTVIAYDYTNQRGKSYWKCRCDCGNEVSISRDSLVRGMTKSCGCIKSQGELKIQNLLNQFKINYTKQYTYKNCKDKNKLPFDFFINNSYLLEYDGIQHFEPTFGEDAFEITQIHDKIKNEYCKSHNIPLIRIPYTHYDKITIDDLRPETSQFLV